MEMYTSESPYSFSGNNPVNNVDPSGMSYYSQKCGEGGSFWYRGERVSCGGGGGKTGSQRIAEQRDRFNAWVDGNVAEMNDNALIDDIIAQVNKRRGFLYAPAFVAYYDLLPLVKGLDMSIFNNMMIDNLSYFFNLMLLDNVNVVGEVASQNNTIKNSNEVSIFNSYDTNSAVKTMDKNVKVKSIHRCAKYVKWGLESGLGYKSGGPNYRSWPFLLQNMGKFY